MTEYSEEFAHSHQNERHIRDPIHDYITISERLVKFIDTPEFQRLRQIKQLGTSYMVFPGAAYNRFEHSLGVMHLCGRLIDTLRENQPGLGITDQERFCVMLAGLCHDLGHGPFSHVWDSQFMPEAMRRRGDDRTWEHEEGSELMFDALCTNNEVEINDFEKALVKDLIRGQPRLSNPPKHKMFLFEIVANKRNGVDVDRIDYIARDNWAIESRADTTAVRLINNARVLDGHVCYHIKDANSVYTLFHTRFNMFKRIYHHKTSRAIEYMIVDALLAADPVLNIAERVFDANKFVYFTDNILYSILENDDERLAESREIIQRIFTRKLYRIVDNMSIGWQQTLEPTFEGDKSFRDVVTPAEIVRCAQAHSAADGDEETKAIVAELNEKHIIVDFSSVHWGMKEKNPFTEVSFYNAKHGKPRAMPPGKEDLTQLLPESFGEYHLRVYTRESRFFGVVQHAFRALLRELGRPIDSFSQAGDQDTNMDGVTTPVMRTASLAAPATPPISREGSLVHAGTAPSTPRTPRRTKSAPSNGNTPPGSASSVPNVSGSMFMNAPHINYDSHPPASPTLSQGRPAALRGVKRAREGDSTTEGLPGLAGGSARKSARLGAAPGGTA